MRPFAAVALGHAPHAPQPAVMSLARLAVMSCDTARVTTTCGRVCPHRSKVLTSELDRLPPPWFPDHVIVVTNKTLENFPPFPGECYRCGSLFQALYGVECKSRIVKPRGNRFLPATR